MNVFIGNCNAHTWYMVYLRCEDLYVRALCYVVLMRVVGPPDYTTGSDRIRAGTFTNCLPIPLEPRSENLVLVTLHTDAALNYSVL